MDWRALHTLAPGRRSPLATLDPAGPAEGDTVLLTEAARIAGVGRAVVVNLRRRHPDFPAPAAGTDIHPRFDRSAVVAWLLAHDKITVPAGMPSATLTVRSAEEREYRFRLDDPVLELSGDAATEDRLSGWTDEEEADALAVLTAAHELSVRRLAAPAAPPLAVLGGGAGDRPVPVRLGRPARHPGLARRPARHRTPDRGRPGPPCSPLLGPGRGVPV
ncbi:hypothetical protein GT043_02305 [Streptomyces sp. SID2131]|nr:hypothetical protein [Streptomyces sp. SID2131]